MYHFMGFQYPKSPPNKQNKLKLLNCWLKEEDGRGRRQLEKWIIHKNKNKSTNKLK